MKFVKDFTGDMANIPIILLIYSDREKIACYSLFTNPYYPHFDDINLSKLWEGLNQLGFTNDLKGNSKSGTLDLNFINHIEPENTTAMLSGFLFPNKF
jgi:hypothetical protein